MRRTLKLLLILLLGSSSLTLGCAPARRDPTLVIGIDGLEWSLLERWFAAGELPNLAALRARGAAGRLASFEPTYSPVIWTTIATGKRPSAHGILHFVKREGGEMRLYTNRDRRTKAVWNIASDYGRTVDTIGWWMTFPAEPIHGVMVAQTNTPGQVDTRYGRAIWKGTLLPGLSGQVYPQSRQAAVMEAAEQVAENLDQRALEIFGSFEAPMSELGRRLWDNTRWALRADLTYERLALDLLCNGGGERDDFDLALVYFGGPDVVGHRFWRYMEPAAYRQAPPPGDEQNFRHVLRDDYRYLDGVVGRLVDCVGPRANVFVISDHGMHAVNRDSAFDPDDPPRDVNSGHHRDAPPGVLIAAGPDIDPSRVAAGETAPILGSVFDIAPTLLALQGIPIGRDFEGHVLDILSDAVPAPGFVASHDSKAWLDARPSELLTPRVEQARQEQLRALGYIE